MIKLKYTAIMSALLLTACSNNSGKIQDLSDITALEITATHAIAIDESASGLSFVPNNVAPWLGRLILQNTDGSLSSTDIEGRATQSISNIKYSDIFGLARENASGVFLAINSENNSLDAFIESDDQGNFAPLSYSGNTLKSQTICSTESADEQTATILTNDNSLSSLSLNVAKDETAKSAPVEQSVISSLPAHENTRLCAVSATHTFAYEQTDTQARLHTYFEGNWSQTDISTDISNIFPLTLNDTSYLLIVDNTDTYLFNADTQLVENKLVVKSGLSIRGLEKTKFIATTTHNFGGAAFSDGLVAFGQADEDRIVFVSRAYLADVINKSGL